MPLADAATTLTAVGALSLLTVAVSYSLNTARRARGEIKELRRDNGVCNWRQAVLVEVMHTARMPVPSWLWGEPPEGVEHMPPESQRSLARRMLDPFADRPDSDD